jgi:hypothetical protein
VSAKSLDIALSAAAWTSLSPHEDAQKVLAALQSISSGSMAEPAQGIQAIQINISITILDFIAILSSFFFAAMGLIYFGPLHGRTKYLFTMIKYNYILHISFHWDGKISWTLSGWNNFCRQWKG